MDGDGKDRIPGEGRATVVAMIVLTALTVLFAAAAAWHLLT
ncbi:hypothetical protein [Streptomyces sp. HNM0574]|nr:hypothetical protein [Streptomyces sp. HNM0574]